MCEFGSRAGLPYIVLRARVYAASIVATQPVVCVISSGKEKTPDGRLRFVTPAHGRAYSVTIGKLTPRTSSKDGASLQVINAKHAKHGGEESMMTALL